MATGDRLLNWVLLAILVIAGVVNLAWNTSVAQRLHDLDLRWERHSETHRNINASIDELLTRTGETDKVIAGQEDIRLSLKRIEELLKTK